MILRLNWVQRWVDGMQIPKEMRESASLAILAMAHCSCQLKQDSHGRRQLIHKAYNDTCAEKFLC